MGLNKQTGNMYPFVSHTWNPIRGKCPHNCNYCYMKKFKIGELRLEKHELNTQLGNNNKIFVGSSTDMFAEEVPKEWIETVLNFLRNSHENTYFFQTKNPERYTEFLTIFPPDSFLGTTIETNRNELINSEAPNISERVKWMTFITTYPKFVSIEPIMDFDTPMMTYYIDTIKPKFVSIGADSKNSNLTEPSITKILQLIRLLKKKTEVRQKKNLKRLLKN